jgi:uncharacterized protein
MDCNMRQAAYHLDDPTLKKIVDSLISEVKPEMIILFGSRANNRADDHSDLDLLIIEREPFSQSRSRRKEMERIWKILSPFKVPKDILVYSREELERRRNSLNHVLGRASREGKILYERH